MKEKEIFKTFRTIVKKVGDEEGVIDMLIPMSTAKTDRHGESIDPKGWKKHLKAFKKRAILLSSHNYGSLQNQIGELLDVQVVEEGLLARPKYYINQGNPEADWGYFIATKGKAAYSVGFIPIKWTDSKEKPTRTYLEQELVEISQVTVPSNTDAAQGLKAKAEYREYDPIIKDIIDEMIEDKDFFMGEEKAKYDCECIKCGEKLTSDKHCKDIKCPKCGGTMRRVERPGPGEKSIKEIITKPEDTEKYIRIPVNDCKITATIDIDKKKGIKALYCGEAKKVATYLFEKAKGWTMAKAKKWVEDHKKYIGDYFENMDWDALEGAEPQEINWEHFKASIEKDEKEEIANAEKNVDNLLKIYEMVKENKELKEKLKDIELKAGAVLNAKNKKNLKDAQRLNQEATALVQAVLDSAGGEEGQEGEGEKDNKKDDPVIIKKDDKKEDPGKDEKTEEDEKKERDKIIAETIEKKVNYLVGKIKK